MNTISNIPTQAYTNTRYTETTSERFAAISTIDSLQPLLDNGWQINGSRVIATRKTNLNRLQFAKHTLHLSHPDLQPIAGHRCEIVTLNGNDSTSSFKLMAGIFRFVCTNGLIVGSSLASIRVNHIGNADKLRTNLLAATQNITKEFPLLAEKVSRWQNIEVSVSDATKYGALAQAMRQDSNIIEVDSLIGSAVANESRRSEDQSNNLWNVFNRTQENMVRGLARVSRKITSLDTNIRMNRQLWDLAEVTASGRIEQAYELSRSMKASEALKLVNN